MPIKKRHKIKVQEEDAKPGWIIFFKRFYKPVALILSIVVFFMAYNVYIVDRSLVDIQFALAQTSQAKSLEDVQGLNIILNSLVTKEILNKNVDSESIVNLDFASGIVEKAEVYNQINDIKFTLTQVLNKKIAKRNKFFIVLDNLKLEIVDFGEYLRSLWVKVTTRKMVIYAPDEDKLQMANELQQKNELAEAIKTYEEILRMEPRYKGMANIYLAYLYERFGNFNKAKIIYGEIINGAPGTQAAGLAMRLLDNISDKKRLVEKKKNVENQILRDSSQKRQQQLYYQLGAIKGLLGDFQGSEQAYGRSVELGPYTYIGQKAKFNLGFSYKMQGKYVDSQKVFEEFSQEFPYNKLAPDSYYWTADSLLGQAKYEEAFVKFEQVSATFKNKYIAPISLFRAGYSCLYDLKDPERAKKYFDKIEKEFSGSPLITHVMTSDYINMGNIYREAGFRFMLQGKFEEAEQNFKEALRYNPADARAYSGLGSIKGLMQNYEGAIVDATKGTRLAPFDSYTYAALGFMYILKNNFVLAMKFYRKALENDPSYAAVEYNIGWIYQNSSRNDKAVDSYKNAIKHDPKMAVAHNNLGSCLWKEEKFEMALDEFSLAVQLDPNLAEVHFNLGVTHFALGHLKQAEAEFSKVIDLDKDFEKAGLLLNLVKQRIAKEEASQQ